MSAEITILKAARTLLEDESKWTQGALARNAQEVSVPLHSHDACKFCLTGAVQLSGEKHSPAAKAAAVYALLNAASVQFNSMPVTVNDRLGYIATMQVLDAAIATLEGGGTWPTYVTVS